MSNLPSVKEILHHLVEIPSPYPFENKIANWVSNFLEKHNFRVHKVPVEDRFCIVGERGKGNALLLFGHLDTVPIQGVEDENRTIATELLSPRCEIVTLNRDNVDVALRDADFITRLRQATAETSGGESSKTSNDK